MDYWRFNIKKNFKTSFLKTFFQHRVCVIRVLQSLSAKIARCCNHTRIMNSAIDGCLYYKLHFL